MNGVFVTGTDTGVGKTLVACAWIHAARQAGHAVAAMKPIAAGAVARDGVLVNEDTEAMLRALDWPADRAPSVTPIVMREAIAPHIAARLEGRRIDLGPVRDAYARLAADGGYMVVEGVGGFRVPLDDERDASELARMFGLPVVMVVGMRLGCLNHALLTAEAIRATGLALAGWIANCVDPQMRYRADSIETLERRLGAPRVGTIPFMGITDAREAARWLRIEAIAR